MKKRGRPDVKDPRDGRDARSGKEGREPTKREEKAQDNIALEDEAQNEGFSEWLRSSSGVELMRLFVVANSLVVFITMAWPNMQEALFIVKDYIMGEED
ncbi:uncharacterized protein LOC105687618 [Athalia rosae]|uniref:uncharacterized protein LOC105687618 n=1 Tax=Athalia rosae TaxID=37344 RepID=UPI0020339EB0|nr:uncharacterized protein LOC105687618 [Athalia rosae]XP_048513311.1 uncharacterized protein LOC105687618 [Athalia rosae]XP_048513312.1 uncharacterized protein LOC105687618 [Athalia rosae]